ncbi:PREDICTED: protein unc-45 homolog A [Nelumbo nucifera]|uniref:Protein unc-45 homolog A n=1 Tax=Nelumbo nucifera TaxID=4432 RepID=A0A1U8BC26_NELNU|nr:PREDICTED: protein unc-45 homolog A [Nelumbo nucifera]
MATASLNLIESAHQMYRDGRHEEALAFYTEALAMVKTKALKIALHSNRAACYLKLHDFKKAAEECTSVLELDHKHTGALMLRAQTLVTLREYHSALFDVNRLIDLNPSSEVYQNLQARLKTQLSLAPIPESEEESLVAEVEEEEEEEEEEKEEEEQQQQQGKEDEMEKEKPVVEAAGQDEKLESTRTTSSAVDKAQIQSHQKSSDTNSKGWEAIPKPKGHSNLDYSRWDRVEDDSSEEEEDEDEDSQPQYRFRVRTIGVRSVK